MRICRIVIALIHVRGKEFVANVLLIIVHVGNFLHAISQMKKRRPMTEVLRIS